MNEKLLIICGPTGTGKTKLALHLAHIFDGELISADSRQVFKGLDIGTGKDRDLLGEIPVWGIDLIEPTIEFSVSQYLKFAQKKIAEIRVRGKLPIVVGGTGLYIKAIVDGIETVDIPKNNKLRKKLDSFSVEKLFAKLAEMDSVKAGSLNLSDRQNPRRLTRAIEVATWRLNNSIVEIKKIKNDILLIGLHAPMEVLKAKIEKRVIERIRAGIKQEIESLLARGVSWSDQSMNAFAYKEWCGYFTGVQTEVEVINKWMVDEFAYARSQMTWFKKDKRIIWFDISTSNYQKKVEDMVKKWYK